jgi:hypothetical protein
MSKREKKKRKKKRRTKESSESELLSFPSSGDRMGGSLIAPDVRYVTHVLRLYCLLAGAAQKTLAMHTSFL